MWCLFLRGIEWCDVVSVFACCGGGDVVWCVDADWSDVVW